MKLLASDLDGTLIGARGTLSARTRAALDACDAAGVPVVFVTGRPARWLDGLTEERSGVAICSNGAVVVDLPDRTVVEATFLSPEVVLEVAARLRAVIPEGSFAVETLAGFRREQGYLRRIFDALDPMTGPLTDLLADDPGVVKLLLREEGIRGDDLLALARPVLEGVAAPTHSNAADGMLEIAALGVSKASALARVADRLGVSSSDVVAFGDMPNDVEMLRWAGRSYAMTGGHPEAIAAASALAPACEDDGVAQVLERLLAGDA